jgi:SAM-dependent methyltransferase
MAPERIIPTLADPTSQLCTQSQLEEPCYSWLCAELGIAPLMNRKHWEFCYIIAAMTKARPLGGRALGFGVGKEPIPAFLRSCGVEVVATDAPPEIGEQWPGHYDDSVRHVDMNDIPPDLTGFDVCWSACALEHIGSLEHGMRFVENAMRTLRPGGIAVHTTEYNTSSNTDTLNAHNLCLYRKRDIEELIRRLAADGHTVWPVNFESGDGELDKHIDLPPYAPNHLKLRISKFDVTSMGLVVRKG